MKNFCLTFYCLMIIASSCKEGDDIGKTYPNTPESVNYDFNDDSVDDFIIEFQVGVWDNGGSSGEFIEGNIVPLDQNCILTKQNDLTLFNNISDTIREVVIKPLIWDNYQHALVEKMNSSENGYLWPNEWGILSYLSNDYYYLGIKINQNENIWIGWIKLRIDKSSGKIQIIEKKLTTEDFIIIDK